VSNVDVTAAAVSVDGWLGGWRRVQSLRSTAGAGLHRLASRRVPDSEALLVAGASLDDRLYVWRVEPRVDDGVDVALLTCLDSTALDRLSGVGTTANAIVSDVVWWSDTALAISRSTGDVFVVALDLAASPVTCRALCAAERYNNALQLSAVAPTGKMFLLERQPKLRQGLFTFFLFWFLNV